MRNQADFIVDPSGNTRDVRISKYSDSGNRGSQVYVTSTQKPDRSSGVIFVPIGLIITLVIMLFRLIIPSPSPSKLPPISSPDISNVSFVQM